MEVFISELTHIFSRTTTAIFRDGCFNLQIVTVLDSLPFMLLLQLMASLLLLVVVLLLLFITVLHCSALEQFCGFYAIQNK